MAGRPAQRVGQRGSRADQAGGGQGGVGGSPDRGPAARVDQGHRVVAVQPGPAVDGRWRARLQPAQHAGRGEDIRDYPVAPVLRRVALVLPGGPHPGEVVEQPAVVHRPQDLIAVGPGRHDGRARRGERVAQDQRPGRHLGALVAHPQPDLAARLVAQAVLAPDHGNRQAGLFAHPGHATAEPGDLSRTWQEVPWAVRAPWRRRESLV